MCCLFVSHWLNLLGRPPAASLWVLVCSSCFWSLSFMDSSMSWGTAWGAPAWAMRWSSLLTSAGAAKVESLYPKWSTKTWRSCNCSLLSLLSPDGQPTLLPPGQVDQLNRRSTGMLSNIQRFFACHLIENFGCDYSTSGLTLDTLQAKIKAFLELRTADGPRHDTYVIFYSGHTHRSGEWALAGNSCVLAFKKMATISRKLYLNKYVFL